MRKQDSPGRPLPAGIGSPRVPGSPPQPLWQELDSGVRGAGRGLPCLRSSACHPLLHSWLRCSRGSASLGEEACRAQTAHSYFITSPPPAKRNSVQRDGNGGGQAEVEREGGDRRGRREGEDKGNGRTGVGREGGKWRGRVEEGGKVKRAQRKGESKWEEN